MASTYKIHLTDGESTKTVTVNHPKLDASQDDLAGAGNAVADGYMLELDTIGLMSETTVYTAA